MVGYVRLYYIFDTDQALEIDVESWTDAMFLLSEVSQNLAEEEELHGAIVSAGASYYRSTCTEKISK